MTFASGTASGKRRVDARPVRSCFAWGSVELLPAAPYATRYRAATHSVGLTLERQAGAHAFASDRPGPFDALPNTLAFTPSGMDVFSESPRGGEYLLVRVDPAAFASMLEEGPAPRVELRRVTQGAHERAGRVARRIRAHLLARASALETEPLLLELLALSARMLARGSGQGGPCAPRAGRRELARVMDLVEAHLDEPLSLERLAGAAGTTPLRLLRSFRAELGTTPHAYLRERRAARARELLARTSLPIAEIALACGFSSQAHLTTAMRQLLGTTPGAWRGPRGRGAALGRPRSSPG